MRIFLFLLFKFFVGVKCVRVVNDVVAERVADGIGECGLLAHQNIVRNESILLKGMAEKIFADAVLVEFFLRVDVHYIIDKVKVAERDSGFQGVHGDAAVRAENIVHVELTDALLGFLLEFRGIRSKVGVLVAEQLIGNLSGEKNADVGVLVNPFADEIHTDRCADRGDVIGAESFDDVSERCDDFISCHDDFMMVRVNVIGNLTCVLEVDGVDVHTDGESLKRLVQNFSGSTAYERGIKTAGEKEADWCIRVETFVDAGHETVVDFLRNGIHIVMSIIGNIAHVAIADEPSVFIIMSRRKWLYSVADADKVLRFGCEDDHAVFIISVIKRADSDRVAGRDVLILFCVVDDEGELGIEHAEHGDTDLFIERQQDLTVRVALKGVAADLQIITERAEAVDFAVADDCASFPGERLHAGSGKTHDGETVEAHVSIACIYDPGIIRTSGSRFGKHFLHFTEFCGFTAVGKYGTHDKVSPLNDLTSKR